MGYCHGLFNSTLRTFFYKRIPKFLLSLNILRNFYCKPKIILKLFLSETRSVLRSKEKFKSLLICYFIIETKQSQEKKTNVV